MPPWTRLLSSYKNFSKTKPYICASITGFSVLSISDITSQKVSKWNTNYPYDYRRTVGLAMFGFLYYGFACRKIYFMYDKLFGMGKPILKSVIDCTLHTPFLLLPSFYFITGTCKGDSVHKIYEQLKSEWIVTASGTSAYWIPLMLISFRYMTPETRILYITSCSYIHKTALSWYTNRERVQNRMEKFDNNNNNNIDTNSNTDTNNQSSNTNNSNSNNNSNNNIKLQNKTNDKTKNVVYSHKLYLNRKTMADDDPKYVTSSKQAFQY